MAGGYVTIANEAMAVARANPALAAPILMLYGDADALHWQGFPCADRWLMHRFGLQLRDARDLVARMVAAGCMEVVDPGTPHTARIVRIVQPGSVERKSERTPERTPERKDDVEEDVVADNGSVPGSAPGSANGSKVITSSTSTSTSTSKDTVVPADEQRLPGWIRKADTPRGVPKATVLAAVVHAIEVATQGLVKNPDRCGTASGPILSLLRVLEWPPFEEWLVDWEIVCEAARECPDPLFARDVRGVDWVGAVDRSRHITTLAVQSRWDARLAAANDWVRRGRPRALDHPTGTGPPTGRESGMARQLRELQDSGFFDEDEPPHGDEKRNLQAGPGAPRWRVPQRPA